MKFTFSVGLIMLISLLAQAQNTSYYTRMNQIFGAIDKTKVTTGYLKDFGVRFNRVESYNGTMDSTNYVDVTQWQSLYNSLYTMRVGAAASGMVAPSSVFPSLKNQQAQNTGVTLLAAQYYNYQQYKTNAVANGDVTVVNQRIYDVAGHNPYDTKTIFAVAPMQYRLKGNTFSFQLPSNMIYTNSNLTLASAAIDFGNGLGYQTISLNTIIYVPYTSGGVKEIKVKFVYANGPTLYSHARLYIDYVPAMYAQNFTGSGAYDTIITGAPYLGASATADVTIETAGTDGVLDKPLIVVEGFDPDNSFNYSDFILNTDPTKKVPQSIDIPIGNSITLNQAIEAEGYDLVFVNYRNSTDYVQRNAYMVEAVIEWVNNNKTGNEKNVVLGMSMGGLVARYALRHMEQTNRTHQVKLYISHDTPHQGANVPIAYQAFVRHLIGEQIGWPAFLSLFTIDVVSLKDMLPQLQDAYDLVQSPAAQQMLIYQLSGTGTGVTVAANSLYSSFAKEYHTMGYPVQGGIRNVAISNGSECGTPLSFAPNATLVSINKTTDLSWLTSNVLLPILYGASFDPIKSLTSLVSTDTDIKAVFTMKALPNQQAQQVYYGNIYIKKLVLGLWEEDDPLIDAISLNSTAAMLPLDNAAGGIYSLDQFAKLPSDLSQSVLQQKFNFVPTYSSLDIGSGTKTIVSTDVTRTYSTISLPNTPFQNFFTNPKSSENHTQFTLNNGNWLMAELKGAPVVTACNYLCPNTDIAPVISGPSPICNQGQFTLSNVPPNTTIMWGASNPSVTLSSGTTTITATRQNYANGGVAIYATVNGACGAKQVPALNVWVGLPYITGMVDGNAVPYPTCDEGNIHFTTFEDHILEASASEGSSGITFHLTYYPSLGIVNGSPLSATKYDFFTKSSTTWFIINAKASNSCGTGYHDFCFSNSSTPIYASASINPNELEVSPNPASDFMNVKLNAETKGENQFQVVIYNRFSQAVYKMHTSDTSFQIPVGSLSNEIYYLHVSFNGTVLQKQIVIER